jgi:hypothetical protein
LIAGRAVYRWWGVDFNDFPFPEFLTRDTRDAQGVLVFDRLVLPEGGDYHTPSLTVGDPFPYPPVADWPKQFRTFRINVSPDEVVVHMKPRPDANEVETHRIPREHFTRAEQRTWTPAIKEYAKRIGASTENLPVLPWTPRAAVGVYAQLSTVAVRNVTITPNPSGDRP